MDQTQPTTSPDAEIARSPRVFRTKYLSDPRRQLRTALMTTSLVTVLLILVNLGFSILRSSHTSILTAAAPQLAPVVEEQSSTLSLTMIVLSVLLVIAVFVGTIVETHRTAGAVYAVQQRLDRVREGDFHVALKLRLRDNLQDLEGPFNEMVASLRKRALDEALALENLAETADSIGNGGTDLAQSLRELAARKKISGT
jgi:methyl-accepting chemotaxis protein